MPCLASVSADVAWLREARYRPGLPAVGKVGYHSAAGRLGMTPALPGRSSRKVTVAYNAHLHGEHYLVEWLINKVKRCRRAFTRFDQLGRRYPGFWHFAAAFVRLR